MFNRERSYIWLLFGPTLNTAHKFVVQDIKLNLKICRNGASNGYLMKFFVAIPNCSTIKKLKQLDILPFISSIIMILCYFIKFSISLCYYLSIPGYINKKHIPYASLTRYTRSMTASDELQLECLIRPRIDAFKNSYFYPTSSMWNDIPLRERSQMTSSI